VKKLAPSHSASSAADADQRDQAVKWASSTTEEPESSKVSVPDKTSTRQKPAKQDTIIDSPESLMIQNFIAAQYPPIEETVSSSVRMGRALVSGALGMLDDDPKMFKTSVQMTDCMVVIPSIKKKSRTPMSGAPPNSINLEQEIAESDDVQRSQSVTDVGVHIELPEIGTEIMAQVAVGSTNDDRVDPEVRIIEGIALSPETVVASLVLPFETEMAAGSRQAGARII